MSWYRRASNFMAFGPRILKQEKGGAVSHPLVVGEFVLFGRVHMHIAAWIWDFDVVFL